MFGLCFLWISLLIAIYTISFHAVCRSTIIHSNTVPSREQSIASLRVRPAETTYNKTSRYSEGAHVNISTLPAPQRIPQGTVGTCCYLILGLNIISTVNNNLLEQLNQEKLWDQLFHMRVEISWKMPMTLGHLWEAHSFLLRLSLQHTVTAKLALGSKSNLPRRTCILQKSKSSSVA